MSSERKYLCWNLNFTKRSLNTCSHPRGQNQRELRMQNIHSLRQSSQTGICTGCSCTFPRCCSLERALRNPGNEQWSLRSGSCLFGRPPILGCAEEIAKRLKTLGLNSCELDNHCTMQQGLTFLEGGIFHGQNGSQNFHFYKRYDICFYNFCENTPLWGKNARNVWKKHSTNISPHFLDAAGGHISDLWLYFHFLHLLHLLQAQLAPFSPIWNICIKKWWTRLK